MTQGQGSATFNPQMLVLAREATGLTQSRLAHLAEITQGHLSKIEAGLIVPPLSLAEKLAQGADYPVEFLFLDEPVYGPGSSEFFHRKQQMSPRVLARLHAQLNVKRIHVSRLLNSVELNRDAIPRLDPDEFLGGTADIARAVRSAWQLSPGPVRNLTKAVEDAGGLVILCDFGSPQLAGVSRWVPGMPPIFFLNKDMPGDRQRLTLAHELGHIVMHQTPRPNMEEEAFAFAAELLMPEAEVRRNFAKGVSLPSLAQMKPVWKVSMGALLMRAAELGVLNERQKRYLWMRMGEAGLRKVEPPELDIPIEQPALLKEIIDTHLDDLGYSVLELATVLATKPHVLRSDYGVIGEDDERPTLRMLKPAR